MQALHRYAAQHGSLPPASDATAAADVLEKAKRLAFERGTEVELSTRLLANLASGARAEMVALAAFFGGIVGQEVPASLTVSVCWGGVRQRMLRRR